MLCTRPFRASGAEFGCGQCLPCRINAKRLWVARVNLEARTHAENSFATLTYAEDQVPVVGGLQVLDRRDCQLFFKRLRKAGFTFRYFGCGEYGDRTFRPHYHLALFGIGMQHQEAVNAAWGKGFVHLGELNEASANYIAGYTTKKMTKPEDPRLQGRPPEFSMMSRRPGIGQGATVMIANSITSNLGASTRVAESLDVPSSVRVQGKEFPIGRYLRRELRKELGWAPETPALAKLKTVYKGRSATMDDLRERERNRAGSEAKAKFRLSVYQQKRKSL